MQFSDRLKHHAGLKMLPPLGDSAVKSISTFSAGIVANSLQWKAQLFTVKKTLISTDLNPVLTLMMKRQIHRQDFTLPPLKCETFQFFPCQLFFTSLFAVKVVCNKNMVRKKTNKKKITLQSKLIITRRKQETQKQLDSSRLDLTVNSYILI